MFCPDRWLGLLQVLEVGRVERPQARCVLLAVLFPQVVRHLHLVFADADLLPMRRQTARRPLQLLGVRIHLVQLVLPRARLHLVLVVFFLPGNLCVRLYASLGRPPHIARALARRQSRRRTL